MWRKTGQIVDGSYLLFLILRSVLRYVLPTKEGKKKNKKGNLRGIARQPKRVAQGNTSPPSPPPPNSWDEVGKRGGGVCVGEEGAVLQR